MGNINVNFDFTSDSPRYREGFWERNDGLGCGRVDPDSRSRTLREYSRILWIKTLPNGEKMILEDGRSKFYLRWKDFYFSNDSITASFRHYDNRILLAKVGERVGGYHSFVESYLRKLYTIGGEIFGNFQTNSQKTMWATTQRNISTMLRFHLYSNL